MNVEALVNVPRAFYIVHFHGLFNLKKDAG